MYINIRAFIILFVCLSFSNLVFGQKSTLSGYVKDALNGEGLIGANVYVKELKVGNSSNTYGFYSITLNPGEYTLVFSSTGYEKIERKVVFSGVSQVLNLELKSASHFNMKTIPKPIFDWIEIDPLHTFSEKEQGSINIEEHGLTSLTKYQIIIKASMSDFKNKQSVSYQVQYTGEAE